MNKTIEQVKEYYGRILKSSSDLKTNACCTAVAPPKYLKDILSVIHPEVLAKYYGCGSPLPTALDGRTVLDLGSGSGRDCFVLSKLVGPNGRIIGIDMTDEQVQVANRHVGFHTTAFQYSKPNVEFRQGYIEDLAGAGIESGSIDVIVSNCVVNLSPDKPRVLKEAWRALKVGGELYFSDVFASRRVPEELVNDPVLYGECLSGALYYEDFRRIMADLGCADVRIVSKAPITVNDEVIKAKLGNIQFFSVTVRAFKIQLEDKCEDYGQVAKYLGTMPVGASGSGAGFLSSVMLDDHHVFEANRPMLVCGNTADMLSKSRYAPYFEIVGNKSKHFGLFDCGPVGGVLGAGAVTGGSGVPNGACC